MTSHGQKVDLSVHLFVQVRWGLPTSAGVPPASHNANCEPLVEGPAITLARRHAKVRRDGYAT